MADSKDEDTKEKVPYEPPRLFNLGGSVAYAAFECKTGPSAAPGKCKDGNVATAGDCDQGGLASGKCKSGGTPK